MNSQSIIRSFSFLVLSLVGIVSELHQVDAQSKIVGGTPTATNRYPYYAVPSGRALCGATLISNDILISAAHCGNLVFKDGIILGGNSLKSSEGRTKYSVVETLIHPLYDSYTSMNDIMLIKISGNVAGPYGVLNYNSSIPVVGQTLSAVGYGTTTEDGSPSTVQLTVDFNTVSYSTCRTVYGSSLRESLVVCNGSENGGKDTCQGDSGGPVFLQGTDTVVGLVSFGYGCGRRGIPAVNTRVSAYKEWIKSSICSMSEYPPLSCFTSPVSAPVSAPVTATSGSCLKSRSRCSYSSTCCSKMCRGFFIRRCY